MVPSYLGREDRRSRQRTVQTAVEIFRLSVGGRTADVFRGALCALCSPLFFVGRFSCQMRSTLGRVVDSICTNSLVVVNDSLFIVPYSSSRMNPEWMISYSYLEFYIYIVRRSSSLLAFCNLLLSLWRRRRRHIRFEFLE
jgi:hypothetical protein